MSQSKEMTSRENCAHNRIVRMEDKGAMGIVYGEWWQCDSCGTRFTPSP